MVRGACSSTGALPGPGQEPGGRLGQHRRERAPRSDWQKQRGLGGFVRSTWDEVNQMIAAANVYTIKKHGPRTASSASRPSRRCR